MRSGCCHCWFEKQPEGPSRRPANGTRVRRRARAEKQTEGVTLVSTRHSAPQFPLHPYSSGSGVEVVGTILFVFWVGGP